MTSGESEQEGGEPGAGERRAGIAGPSTTRTVAASSSAGHGTEGSGVGGRRRSMLARPAVLLGAAGMLTAATCAGLLLSGESAASPVRHGAASLPSIRAGVGAAAHARSTDSSTPSPATVTVVGSATVTGAPDTLTLSMGVSVRAASATAALDTSSTELDALQKVFISSGVAPKDLQTSFLDLQPNYSSNGRVTGYEADDQLTITLHPIAKAGLVIDAAAHAVGNDVRINGISFSIADTTPLLARARTAAVHQAATDAAQLAAAAGTTLGPIVSVTDETSQPTGPSGASGTLAYASAAPASTPVPVRSGIEQVTAQVQVVYQLGS